MCGIAGLVDPITPPNDDLLREMSRSLVKRGPDDEGIHRSGEMGFIHRRLSIIDIDGGRQPIFNEDETLGIVCNGEIYDYAELRQSLIAGGHRFRTSTDTEVLLHLYEDRGPEFVRTINGMFAFAIFDLQKRELFLARDRCGQKPLFYAQNGQRFAFASGPSSLSHLPWVDTSINHTAIHDYLEFQYIPAPDSIYRGINKLLPGSYALWKDGQLTTHQYWEAQISGDFADSYESAQESLKGALNDAVRRRLIADVPVGLFLSGGMDSSLICAIAQRHLSVPAETFSIGFPDKRYDERGYAKRVADYLGTKHHFLEVVPDDFGALNAIVNDYDEPFCDASMLPTTILAKFAREHVKVALSGDGADELFGGYERYQVMKFCQWLSGIPRSFRKKIARIIANMIPRRLNERTFWGRLRRLVEINSADGIERYMKLMSRFPDALKRRLYGNRMKNGEDLRESVAILEACYNPGRDQDFIDKIMELDIKSYLPGDILTKVDRASMAHGLEVRSPFLDPTVIDTAITIPHSWKQHGSVRKKILLDSFSGWLPDDILRRRKMGFGVPLARWFRCEWYDHAKSVLLHGRLVDEEYFERTQVEWLINSHHAGIADYSYALFALTALELWFRQENRAP